jgi:hypothetical protein
MQVQISYESWILVFECGGALIKKRLIRDLIDRDDLTGV